MFSESAVREIMADMRFRVRVAVLLAMFAGHLTITAQSPPDRIGPITSALREGNSKKALELLQQELQQNPKNAQLWTLQGIAFSGEGDKKDALGAFRHALGISPDYLPALEGAAQIEYENGGKDAVTLLQHILQLHPGDPTSHAMLGVLAYRRGDCTAAVPHFEHSGSLVDSQPGALQQYGECLLRLKKTEKAIAVFRRAMAQAEADAGARYRLASVQMMAQQPKDAIETLDPLLQAHPDAAVLALAAEAYEADNNTPEAVKLLHQAIVQDPQDVDLYLQFANVSFVHQSFQVGIDMIDAGLKVQPKAAPLYLARGILYVQLADYEHGEADFEKVTELDPHLGLTEAAQGMIAEQRNDLDKALAVVRAKLAKHPKDAFLLYVQADILLQKNPDAGAPEFREAVASARKAVNLQPNLVYAHDTLAKLYLEAGQNQQAVDESKQALRYDPKDQVALYHLIVGLRKTGHTAELPDLLKRLAELRQEATKEEAEHNRYKLVEQTQPGEPQKVP
jgi:tetratricopeptide (TPR) repeat protein